MPKSTHIPGSYVRNATSEELEDAKTFRNVKVIAAKHGNFQLAEPGNELPSDGIVYNMDDINKHTNIVILNERKYVGVPE
ncbi:hypothetical protein WJ0W_006109 [Paenibacillus melissococcoides]|uniref:Uncharacterized protein n=1 Tax=Paenibacillus melissococcoides TaxID=2912268 RepID=A0ABM9GCH6_9BACL|nr:MULTISPECIES: hypothetical protein [Paenibacillus]MEB9897791.1 hypothetical protein [Bacillus cereus]CAH8248926.1 hypothetical protein WJ0W_006109 [Paenibacillus melissococcoides]CAH8720810.1 hypothetical protein HTL2_006061 [Paenibacillus melissococcoides]CAH8720856.1 hypothetical protein WDD9_006021 [Paenibacillus melissococcoides]GIO81159.1 hypothetical protein J6TS7_47690 [Paenibacillus dendritiformis]